MRTAVLIATLLASIASGASPNNLIAVDEAALRNLISSHKGKVVLLSFWATWCEPCRAEMPHIVALDQKLAPKGLEVLVISADEPEQEHDALRFVRDQHVAMPAYIKRAQSDQQFIDSIDAKWSGALPALFLYDRAGRRIKSWIGEADFSVVEAEIRSQLARH